MTKPAHHLPCLLLACFLMVAGCETERPPCLSPRNALARGGAYRHTADTGIAVQDSALPSPVLTALGSFSTANTFIQTTGRNKFSFQLSDLSDTCRWVLRPDSAAAVQDTLTFYYSRQLHFISNACGYNYFYFLRGITATRHAIDSVRITSNDITSDASVEHFKIYY